jgi:hypothetical protein
VANSLPPIAANALRQLGENIAIARARRKEPQRVWAERIGISVPTLIRLEKGDPTVGMGPTRRAVAHWAVQALGDLAAPATDLGAWNWMCESAGHARARAASISAPRATPARVEVTNYRVTDELYLWWLGRPQSPVPIGTLRLMRATSGVSLQYAPGWLRNGFALSEDLPLTDIEQRPSERATAAGAVDDARPDRWGERVTRFVDKPPPVAARVPVLRRRRALRCPRRFHVADAYLPQQTGSLPTLRDVDEIHELVRKVLDNEPVPEASVA